MRPLLFRLAKALFEMALSKAFEKALPQVFSRIDAELPVLLANRAAPVQVSGLIGSAIADATGQKATAQQLQAVIALYNPVAAALRNLQD